MLILFTLVLSLASLAHLFLFAYNRWLLCLDDGPLKHPIHAVWFLISCGVPGATLVLGSFTAVGRDFLSGRANEGLFPLFIGMLALIAFWIARSILWLQDRLTPERPRNLISERIVRPEVPSIPSALPRVLRGFETTGDLQVVQREIVVSGLAPGFDGLRIVQVSDVHFGQRLEMENYLRAIREIVEKLDGDLLVMTGDFVDRRRDIVRSVEYHAGFRGRLGTYAVLGNHDYWTRPARIIEELSRTHIRYLGGGERRIFKKNGRRLVFVGTDSPWNHQRPDLDRLIRRGTGDAVVLLSHTPDNAPRAARAGASLILSGHNHGGQMCLPWAGPFVVPSRFGLRYAGGIYQVGAESVLNVSRGIGVSSGGVRILCPPEITVLTLRAPHVDVMVGRVIPASAVLRPVQSGGWVGQVGRTENLG